MQIKFELNPLLIAGGSIPFYQWNMVLKVKTITPATIEYRHLLISLLTSFRSLSNRLMSSLVTRLNNALSNALAWLNDCSSDKPDFLRSSKNSHDVSVAILSYPSISKNFRHSYRSAGDKSTIFEEAILPYFPAVSSVFFFFFGQVLHNIFKPMSHFFATLSQENTKLFSCSCMYSHRKHHPWILVFFDVLFVHHILLVLNNNGLMDNVNTANKTFLIYLLTAIMKACFNGFIKISEVYRSRPPAHLSQLNLTRRLSHV